MVEMAFRVRSCLLLSLIALAPIAAGCGGEPPRTRGKAAELADAGPRHIVALGRIEPAGGVLEISAIPGDVLKGFAPGVVEGAVVDAGAELARVKSYDLRATQLEAAEAKLSVGRQQRDQETALAQANHQQALAGKAEVDAKLEEIEAQELALEAMAEAARIAVADYQSLVELQSSDPELVTPHQLRRKRNQADQAAREYDVHKRTQAAAKKAALAAVKAASENIRVAEINLKLATEVDRNLVSVIERKVAAETLEQSILRAPSAAKDGAGKFTVLKINMEPGEFVTQIPVMQIGNLNQMVCIAEVYEADVKEIEAGQTVQIRSAAFSGKYADGDANGDGAGGLPGKVIRVGSLVSTAGLIQRNPLAPSDRSIVEVLVAIEGANDAETARATAEAARHIGMQVTVQFSPKKAPAKRAAASPAAKSSKDDAKDASKK
jgi:HlyD family secretion protein